MKQDIEALIGLWKKRNIEGFYCENKKQAQDKILSIIPESATIGISGSQTLEQLDIASKLGPRGAKFFNQNKPGLSREENKQLRRLGANADYYLASANAVAMTGELVFFSAYGNRIAGISYAEHVLVVCGINKLEQDLGKAMKRAREYVTPLNCKRLNWNSPCFADGACKQDICLFPEYKRMCCQVLVIEAEVIPERFKVILVGEELGF